MLLCWRCVFNLFLYIVLYAAIWKCKSICAMMMPGSQDIQNMVVSQIAYCRHLWWWYINNNIIWITFPFPFPFYLYNVSKRHVSNFIIKNGVINLMKMEYLLYNHPINNFPNEYLFIDSHRVFVLNGNLTNNESAMAGVAETKCCKTYRTANYIRQGYFIPNGWNERKCWWSLNHFEN